MAKEPLELTRHFESLSPEDTDAVVGIVAGMIVRFLQAKGDARKPELKPPGKALLVRIVEMLTKMTLKALGPKAYG